jgi:hypothetical protein
MQELRRVFITVACGALLAITAPLAAQSGSALKVTSFPSGAKVSIEGLDTGKVTPMSVSLSIGEHTVIVSVRNSGWNADSRTVTIVSGNNDLSVTLLPILTRAAGPCFDSTNRYVDCGNGTVTDTVTGLIWLKDAYCLGSWDWTTANQAAAGLKTGGCGGTLADGSSPGDWRLPTKAEWTATMAKALELGCGYPQITNDAGTACYTVGHCCL